MDAAASIGTTDQSRKPSPFVAPIRDFFTRRGGDRRGHLSQGPQGPKQAW